MRLLVAIPCLDEARTVGKVVGGIPETIPGIGRIEILVIDDGSTDDTARWARDAGAEVVRHSTNMGLGATFHEAVEVALTRGSDLMVQIDGDGQFNPGDMTELIAPIVQGRAEMVTASRFLDPEITPSMPAIRRWGNWGVSWIVRRLTGKRLRDVSCGYRAFSREALLRMNLFGRFTYTQETILDLAYKNLEILEIPIRVRGTREHGESRVASSLPRYGFHSLWIMLKAFVSYRPFRFFATIAAVFFVIGLGFLGFLGVHYIRSGAFSPHIWAGFVGGSFAFMGVITLVIGLVGEMLVQIRMNQEQILYLLKRSGWDEARASHKD